jgi:flagellar biosynthesis component FlhA
MSPDAIVTGVLVALFSALAAWLAFRKTIKILESQLQHEKSEVRDLEGRLHQQQREAAAERNRLELEHQERGKAIRSSAFEDGRQLGLAEGQREHVTELTKQQESYAQRIAQEREQVARETREKTRAEFEMQAKLYDVSVRPYLNIDKVKGLFKDEELVEAGYQYQLLVNGIPAFQPSVVIEETRRSSKVNEENIKALLQVAERAAKAAAELYLGAGAAAAKLGPAIVRRLAK